MHVYVMFQFYPWFDLIFFYIGVAMVTNINFDFLEQIDISIIVFISPL